MPRYIDSEKIKLTSMTWIDGGQDVLVPLVSVKKAIAQTPTEEDVVKVVRCRECRHWYNQGYDPIINRKFGSCTCDQWEHPEEYFETDENDYCSYGEREE